MPSLASYRRVACLEALEPKLLLTTFYVDNNLFLTADRDQSGGLSPGDQVTFGNGQSYQQADLTYDAAPVDGDVGTAFSSISEALASPLVLSSDIIEIAGGTYTESVTVDKSLTLQGEGNVVLQSPTAGGIAASITVSGNPDNVTLDNLDFSSPGYSAGLVDDGGDTLNLTDVSGVDTFSILGVTNLNIARTTSTSQQVRITPFDPGIVEYTTLNPPFSSPTPPFNSAFTGEVYFQDRTNFDFQATNLSISTGAGDDSFIVAPNLNTTVTINGGGPTPPALPGNSLTVLLGNPNDLTLTNGPTGYAGTWTSSDYQPIHFSHIESLGPGDLVEREQGISQTLGQSFNGEVLGFDDTVPNLPLSDYTAAIDWGDGQTSAGTVVAGSSLGTFAVDGSHTYASAGEFSVTVAISRPGTFDTALTATAVVYEPPPLGSGVTLSATAGQAMGTATGSGTPSAVVGTFVDAGWNISNADEFTAAISWGDGSSSTGVVSQSPGGGPNEWEVSGSHVYATDGNYQITVIVDSTFADPFVSIKSQANIAPVTVSPATSTTFYVDNNLKLTDDRDQSGGLSPGDQVTFGNGQSYQQADLTYDAAPVDGDVGTAFSSISQALASPLVQAGDTIEIASGTYTESGLTIDEGLTLDGEGSVIIASPQNASQPGVSIVDQPDSVTLKNISIQGFQTSLSDTGGGTLTLVDVGLIDGETSVSNLDNLDIVSDATASGSVIIDIVRYVQALAAVAGGDASPSTSGAAPPSDALDNIWSPGQFLITFSDVKNLSFATGAGVHDTIGASPLPDTTVTIDGNGSTPPGAPGDTLEMPTNFFPGSSLTATRDATGLSGTWTVSGSQPVNFSRIASLSPGIATQTVPPITGTQGVDTGSQVVAQFTDPAVDALAAGDTAEIYWQDGSTSAGAITYDASTGVYSVLGSHTYSEAGSYTVGVNLTTPDDVVILPNASANIAGTTAAQMSVVEQWTLMPTVGQSTSNMDLVTFRDSVHLPASDYSAEINWGDGMSSSGYIASGTNPWPFTVFGDHSYAQPGIDHIAVTIYRDGAIAGTFTATAYVSEQTFTDTSETLSGTAGVALGGSTGALLATFEEPLTDTGDFQAAIDWGDGSTSSGTVVEQGATPGASDEHISWHVYGSHTYQQPGTYDVRVSLTQYLSPTETANVVSWIDSAATISASNPGANAPIVTNPPPTATGEPPSLTPSQQFVSNVYNNLLHRPADPSGRAFWAGQLDAGLSRAQFVVDVEATLEYRDGEVTSLFEHYLRRAAEPAALKGDSQLLAQGMTDEQLAAMIIGSDEYFALHGGTNEGFLNSLFQDALNRPIDVSAKAAFEQALAAGATRAQIAAIVFSSHEFHTDLVQTVYLDMLDRAAESSGDAYWADQLDSGTTDEGLLAEIVASDEYSHK